MAIIDELKLEAGSMDNKIITSLADEIFNAQIDLNTIESPKLRHPGFDISSAYEVARIVSKRRLSLANEVEIGKKVGLTNPIVQKVFSVDQPDFGILTSSMFFENKSVVDIDKTLIRPKAEGEIAFLLKKDLLGPGLNFTQVLGAIDYALPCFEIVDSRIRDWKITIEDTIADNASCGIFVLGSTPTSIKNLDLRTCGMVLEKNGLVVTTGAGAAVLGSPINALVWLANTFGEFGVPLKAGEIILSGSMGEMIDITHGDRLKLQIGSIGECEVSFPKSTNSPSL